MEYWDWSRISLAPGLGGRLDQALYPDGGASLATDFLNRNENSQVLSAATPKPRKSGDELLGYIDVKRVGIWASAIGARGSANL
jgi:hypothetical protein